MHRAAVKELEEKYGADKLIRKRSYYELTQYGQAFCKVSLPAEG
jgi:DNA-binding transcriptional LysR family regulator